MEIKLLSEPHLEWFVEIAAVDMLIKELKRPELVNKQHLFLMSIKAMEEGTAWIVEHEGKPLGALGAYLVGHLYNPEIKVLTELFWYVPEEYRQSRVGLMLLNAFDEKAEQCAHESTLSLLLDSPIRTETLEKKGWYMEELGFRKVYT